jgi:hypothetical protein
MHLDDVQLQRMLHREPGGAEPSLGEHLSTCVDCRSRLTEAEQDEQWVLQRLRALDHAARPVSVEQIIASASARAPVWHRWAAGIVLLLMAAGVAYAAPGSPLPGVVHRLIGLLQGREESRAAPIPPPPVDASQAGIAVDPGRRLTIVFAGDQPEGVAIVSLSDGSEIVLRAAGGTTAFTSDIDRVTIDHSGQPATTEILIPRHAPRVEIRARGRRIFLKADSSIVTSARPDPEGRYRLPLASESR